MNHVPAAANPIISLQTVLEQERDEVLRSRAGRLDVNEKLPDDKLVGLAFSGGGIRSATFNLGVLQAFSHRKVLRYFDYLSTVSGGGYIGCWLMGWMRNQGQGVRAIEDQLSAHRYSADKLAEPNQLRFLRSFSNYLTPRKSLIGADFWTFISSYLRNTLLNQIIFVALLVCTLLVPRLLNYLVVSLYGHSHDEETAFSMATDAFVVFLFLVSSVIAVTRIRNNLAYLPGPPPGQKSFPGFTEQPSILRWIICPLLLSAFIFLQLLHHFAIIDKLQEFIFTHSPRIRIPRTLLSSLLGAVVYGGLWFVAMFLGPPGRVYAGLKTSRKQMVWLAVVAGGIGGSLLAPMLKILSATSPEPVRSWQSWHYSAFGLPLLMAVMLGTASLHIGLLGPILCDAMREWWARLGAWLILLSCLWIGLFTVAIYAPLAISHLWVGQHHVLTISAVVGWVLHTIFGLKFGKSSLVGPSAVDESGGMLSSVSNPAAKKALNVIARLAPYAFAAGMLVLVALMISLVLDDSIGQLPSTHYRTRLLTLLFFLVSFLTARIFSSRLDVNQFSMHSLYRNRLVRCYLGASCNNRTPQPFIGFDLKDDFSLNDIKPVENGDGRPFPIINTTLNVVRGKELALQTRKARSFFFTPLYCGFNRVRPNEPKMAEPKVSAAGNSDFDDFFALTKDYDAISAKDHAAEGKTPGVPIGTAMTISGAAASPNMGYHSSPALSFLMTLFDVRLGWWMANPRCPAWEKDGPRNGFKWLIYELFGLTSDDREYLYLSDGGHFENLGIYELVRRRCKVVVACDAARDPGCAFGDLQIAIERCRSDFNVEIEFERGTLDPLAPSNGLSTAHFGIGKIHYTPGSEADDGVLIYLKPTLTGDESLDVLGYPKRNPDFPHDPTTNQWFDEDHFESYRALGQHIGLIAADTIHSKIFDQFQPQTRAQSAR